MATQIIRLIFLTLVLLAVGACDGDGGSNAATAVDDPPIDELADTDGDGLADLSEVEGWRISVYLADGERRQLEVTSDPERADTDADGVLDGYEKSALTDPRNPDTDDDGLSDSQELFDIYSKPYAQDTDGDGMNDGVEFNFHRTSPVAVDSDGDQLNDHDEVLLATRNPRAADLPAPAIEIGEIDLQLDVRFTESTSVQTRELENRTVSSTLTQSDRQEYSNTNSNTQQAHAKLSFGTSYEVKGSIFGPGGQWNSKVDFETGWTGSWTSSHTETSAQETQEAYEESLSTDEEVTEGATVTRSVEGARMQVAVTIENTGALAYRIHNLQVTAFIQDPQDHTRLTPVATLLPDNEPADGFHLGPLVPSRGPFIFSNDLVFPNMVESLMKNPRGLVFSISNYDIVDELGRNFVFSSQEVVERTAALVIDFGSYDSDGDQEGDLTEYHRVATSCGRSMDDGDHRIVFDEHGDHVGMTLRDALDAIGLRHYAESEVPTSSLTEIELEESYSTVIDDAGVERFYRVRKAAVEVGVPKAWEILTPTGIDQTIGPDHFILKTEDDIKLAFVQDLDQDRLVASLEFVHNCSDMLADTDDDGLDDRAETLVGWTVDTSAGSRTVYSRCSVADTDRDGLSDAEEAGAPIDCDGSPAASWVTDPSSADTDEDGIPDREEICGYEVILKDTQETIVVTTDPTKRDTDGDTAPDGIERDLGGDPTDPGDIDQFADADGDGLVNYQEVEGWEITVYGVSGLVVDEEGMLVDETCYSECQQGIPVTLLVTSDPYNGDTDSDGLPDGTEKTLGTNPGARDTDGDGLDDAVETDGFTLRDLGIIVLDPIDADTDNDKRSDGEEAEREDHVTTRWIVRPYGEEAYRVFSDPRTADADFDTVVDGDEYRHGSDPTIANTDGDRRDDASEIENELDPLRPDVEITVFYRSVELNEGETGEFTGGDNTIDGDAEFLFEFDVRLPDSSRPASPTGLAQPTRVIDDFSMWKLRSIYGRGVPYCANGDAVSHPDAPCLVGGPGSVTAPGVQIGANSPLELFRREYDIDDWERSETFAVAKGQRFSIEGRVGEHDVHVVGGSAQSAYHYLQFGGLDGTPAKLNGGVVPAVFDFEDVEADTIGHLRFEFSDPDWHGMPPREAPAGGTVHVMYVVN